jgi:hypothetical protein
MINQVPSKGLEVTNLVLGAALACAAFMFSGTPAAAWNAGVTGLLIAAFSYAALKSYAPWTEWSNLALGCWVVAAPFLLNFVSAELATWTHVLLGACVASIAASQLLLGRFSSGTLSPR